MGIIFTRFIRQRRRVAAGVSTYARDLTYGQYGQLSIYFWSSNSFFWI